MKEKIQDYYVYELAYPDGTPFYYGKGHGDRINQHEREARLYLSGNNPYKIATILKILEDGNEIIKRKIAHFSDEQDAYMYEWAMINMTCIADQLTNGGNPQTHCKSREYITSLASEKRVTRESSDEENKERLSYVIWKIRGLNLPEKLVLLALADSIDDDSMNAHPKIAMLVERTSASTQTVKRCIKRLEEAQLIKVKRGTGKSHSDYTLTLPPALLAEYDSKVQREKTICASCHTLFHREGKLAQ